MEDLVKVEIKFKDKGWFWIGEEKKDINQIVDDPKALIGDLFELKTNIEEARIIDDSLNNILDSFKNILNHQFEEDLRLQEIEEIRVLDLNNLKSYILTYQPHLLKLGVKKLYIEKVIQLQTHAGK